MLSAALGMLAMLLVVFGAGGYADGVAMTAEEPADGHPHESVDSAQLYAKYRRLAAEQAALRRLATLVARGAEPAGGFWRGDRGMRRCVARGHRRIVSLRDEWRAYARGRYCPSCGGGEMAAGHPNPVWKAPPSLRWYYAPAGPHGSTATTTLPGRSRLACARWACARRSGCRSSLMDACGARAAVGSAATRPYASRHRGADRPLRRTDLRCTRGRLSRRAEAATPWLRGHNV